MAKKEEKREEKYFTLSRKGISALLLTKFTAEQASGILEVVEATPNPDVAIEILFDLYSDPEFKSRGFPMPDADKPEVVQPKLMNPNYDKWQGDIIFEYQREKIAHGYFPTTLPKEERNKETQMEYNSMFVNGKRQEGYEQYEFNTGDKETVKRRVKLGEWNGNSSNQRLVEYYSRPIA